MVQIKSKSGRVLYRVEADNLRYADLSYANLHNADLRYADLSYANLRYADLSYADLHGANLRYADLRYANLRDAHLHNAQLVGTCLEPVESPWSWCKRHGCICRSVDGRTLVLGSRTTNQPVLNGPDYEVGRLYVAPIFSRCPVTSCHPGLYVGAGCGDEKEDMLIAFWLDELHVAGDKARVPRFRTVATVDEFNTLTAADLEPPPRE